MGIEVEESVRGSLKRDGSLNRSLNTPRSFNLSINLSTNSLFPIILRESRKLIRNSIKSHKLSYCRLSK